MTLDLSFQLTGLPPDGGGPAPELGSTAARALANALMGSTKGDSVKQHSQAIMLAECGKVEVDTSDLETLLQFVKSCENLTTAAKGPIQKAIIKLKT